SQGYPRLALLPLLFLCFRGVCRIGALVAALPDGCLWGGYQNGRPTCGRLLTLSQHFPCLGWLVIRSLRRPYGDVRNLLGFAGVLLPSVLSGNGLCGTWYQG